MTAVTMARPRPADVPPAMARVGMFDFSVLSVVFETGEAPHLLLTVYNLINNIPTPSMQSFFGVLVVTKDHYIPGTLLRRYDGSDNGAAKAGRCSSSNG
jgi:hypothetical protein